MLSVLIPTYNYNTFPLVAELQKQADSSGIDYEILVQDDCSNDFLIENNKINTLKYCSFCSNEINLGRAKNRNHLASKAKFPWLLLLDCDMFPKESNFIENYLLTIKNINKSVVFGGITYKIKRPEKEQLLRWHYGHKRESISLENRIKKPNSRALTSNLLINKKLFLDHPFDSAITKYGYEDLSFLMTLERNKILVSHIDNPAFHLNLESSSLFLNKTRIALENLAFINSQQTTLSDSKIISVYSALNKIRITLVIVFLFNVFENKMINNLLSQNPSLLVFDLYKLGYFCKLQSR
ncbi:glycosyltransferase family 2 protein [Flavobacterium fluviatile]|uniref:glycosyltransferase family 2 protein n=1 Tax=Flavobacterium fluviatile TaxID=1862387 RepID=UPI0013D04FDB|nr:glycosyltransferase [Flavobacterium fluviatile]